MCGQPATSKEVSCSAMKIWCLLDNSMAGLKFAAKETLPNRSREDAEALVASHGGKAGSSVSKKTSYVVVGTDPGSKFDKAKSLGVPILDEAGFEKVLNAKWEECFSGAEK
jgi:DNA ligase (NAD+)